MKLIASMMLTLDGVYQGPGGPDEDRRGGFERGGWTAAVRRRGELAVPDVVVRARGRVAARAQDVGDLGAVLAAPRRRAIRSRTASTSCPSTCRRPRSRTRPGRTPTSSTATSRRRCASSRRSPDASSRSTAAATCSGGCSSATSSTSSTCGSIRSWSARGFGSSRSVARRTTWGWSTRGRRRRAWCSRPIGRPGARRSGTPAK